MRRLLFRCRASSQRTLGGADVVGGLVVWWHGERLGRQRRRHATVRPTVISYINNERAPPQYSSGPWGRQHEAPGPHRRLLFRGGPSVLETGLQQALSRHMTQYKYFVRITQYGVDPSTTSIPALTTHHHHHPGCGLVSHRGPCGTGAGTILYCNSLIHTQDSSTVFRTDDQPSVWRGHDRMIE